MKTTSPRKAAAPRTATRCTSRPVAASSSRLSPTLIRELRALAGALRAKTLPAQDIGRGHLVLVEGPDGALREQAAMVLAEKLGKELYRVRLADVISRHRGETEQNLDRVFDEAKKAGGLVVFEGADALFGQAAPRPSRVRKADLNRFLGLLRQNTAASVLSAAHVRKIDPSVLDAVRAVFRLAGGRKH